MIILDNRLKTIYDMIRDGSKILDVGSDHGYLITKLILDNKCISGKCVDINEKCLNKAKKLADEYNITDKIIFSLSDGLKGVKENEIDDIVIAGMGSQLIVRILNDCDWIKKKNDKYLILQPMLKPWILREYLYKNGFKIIDERVVISHNFFYVVIGAKFIGEIKEYSDIDVLVGTLLNNININTKKYFYFLANKFEMIAQNILLNGNDLKKYNYYKTRSDQIKNLLKNN